MEFSEARKKPYFYVAIACVFLTGLSLTGIGELLAPNMYDLGITPTFVATLLTVGSLCLMASKLVIGFLFDRFGLKLTMNICYVCSFLTLFAVILTSTSTFGLIMATASKVLDSFALPLETVMIPLFASELFHPNPLPEKKK